MKKEWITNGADAEMVEYTEQTGRKLKNDKLSSSQIRNVFGELKRIEISGFDKNKESFYLLKPKVAYAAGRNGTRGIKLFKEIFDEGFKYVTNEREFKNFCNLIEALIAYHKFYGGK